MTFQSGIACDGLLAVGEVEAVVQVEVEQLDLIALLEGDERLIAVRGVSRLGVIVYLQLLTVLVSVALTVVGTDVKLVYQPPRLQSVHAMEPIEVAIVTARLTFVGLIDVLLSLADSNGGE